MSRFYSIDEIIREAGANNYVAGELINAQGQKLSSHNAAKDKPGKWLRTKVKPYLEMPQRPAGVYYINLYFQANKKTAPDQFALKVGNIAGEAPPIAPVIHVQAPQLREPKDNPLDWNAALNYQQTISDLRAQVTALTLEKNSLLQRISDLEADADDQAPGLGENLQAFFKDAILPGVNMFFENQKKNREMQFFQMAQGNPNLWYTPQGMEILTGRAQMPGQMPQPPMPQQQAPQQQAPQLDTNSQLINTFFENVPDEIFNRIDALKQQGDKVEAFIARIAENEPDLYASLVQFVNANGGQL